MRITGPNRIFESAAGNRRAALRAVLLYVFCAALCPAAEESPVPSLARLASALSRNDSVSALEVFDSSLPGYAGLEANLTALTAQTDILCALDVVSDMEADGVHTVDVDWYMQLKPQGDAGRVERRRERVTLKMKLFRGKWRITSLSPVSILSPVTLP